MHEVCTSMADERNELLRHGPSANAGGEQPRHLLNVPRSMPTASLASSSRSTIASSTAVDDLLMGFSRTSWMLFSVAGGLIYGYNVSMAATLQYVRDALELSASHLEAVSAAATLSDASSMLVGGFLADRFGRRSTAMFACLCSVVGCILSSVASVSFGWLLCWRLLTGVGNGLSILLVPMYISESVDASNRGTMLTLFQLGVNSGCALPYLVMIVISEEWRTCLAFGALPALYILYQFVFRLPESVKWTHRQQALVDVFDLEDDSRSLKSPVPPPTPSPRGSASPPNSPPQSPTTRSRPTFELAIGILLAYVNNCVDASLFYGPEIISKAIPHYSSKDANLFGLLCSLLAAVSVVFAIKFLVNRFARRQLYLICLTIVVLTFWLSSAIFANYSTEDFSKSKTAAISIIVTFAVMNIFSTIGPSILFVVILNELFTDSNYRAKYMSYCTFAMSFFALLINGTLLTLFETFGTAATFTFYGATYAACLLFFWRYLPETKHRELE
ncbi:TPA: hypothetical protein N0F65_010345 [Lagenidium giganteum]|uniref:Major facilitator superfamily (MFS) profile domain-containing protein n=1 Tax=Lagenidium giganteum TaxID=4803 RepID=A0AAV2Z8F9_9STRA|nr:TPA: hypothetical protein N0F65_010345 [Lagenidium giganteum]